MTILLSESVLIVPIYNDEDNYYEFDTIKINGPFKYIMNWFRHQNIENIRIDFKNVDTSAVTDFSHTFENISGEIYNLNTSNATNTSYMFYNSWIEIMTECDFSNVINSEYMFCNYRLSIIIKGNMFSKSKNIRNMFHKCKKVSLTSEKFPIYKNVNLYYKMKPINKIHQLSIFIKSMNEHEIIDLLTIYFSNNDRIPYDLLFNKALEIFKKLKYNKWFNFIMSSYPNFIVTQLDDTDTELLKTITDLYMKIVNKNNKLGISINEFKLFYNKWVYGANDL